MSANAAQSSSRAYPKNTDISRGHTADCPNFRTHFPWVCDCHAREATTPMWLRELRRDRREFTV